LPDHRDGGSVKDDPADHDRAGEDSQVRATLAGGKTCHLHKQAHPFQNYPAARIKVGLSDPHMLQQVQAKLQQQVKRMQAHEQRAEAQTKTMLAIPAPVVRACHAAAGSQLVGQGSRSCWVAELLATCQTHIFCQ
jgi:hypothetical protein